jgi:hypothetical protein
MIHLKVNDTIYMMQDILFSYQLSAVSLQQKQFSLKADG